MMKERCALRNACSMRNRMSEESNPTIPCESLGSPSPTAPSEGQVRQDQDDAVMQEAIRRSLVDVAAKKEPEGVEPKESTAESPTLSAETVTIPPCDEEEYVIEAVKVETVEEESIAEFEPPSPSIEKETSFASEAAGSGEIAEFVGETLDRMSEAIESLSSQLADGNHDDDKIVDGEEDVHSEASWSVVVTEFQDGDTDREIARAAEAIGSALFNSDVLRSSENFSAMSAHSMGESVGSSSSGSSSSSSSSSSSDDEQFSSVTSVPTTIHSLAPGTDHLTEYQLNRWAVQLEQLHEMGFTNDALCVEVIESLAAANIGVDSQDEVSVQQVVDKLMNGW
jgi:hypothetical protein